MTVYVVSKGMVPRQNWTGGNLVSKDKVSERDQGQRVRKHKASYVEGKRVSEEAMSEQDRLPTW